MTDSAWVERGTERLLAATGALTDAQLGQPSRLAGWTRAHLLAHLAANAEALGRLLSWARTGVENRMYASPEQRNADIEAGSSRQPAEIRYWLRASAADLASAMAEMPEDAWRASVVTAQGRTVPASQVRWLRAREVFIHAVDLDAGVEFTDLPEDFLAALVEEITGWRAARPGPALRIHTDTAGLDVPGSGEPVAVRLSTADAAAWLSGRLDRPGLPALPGWL